MCVDPNDIPDIAVVDPDMMSSMPRGLTASTGMDALTHAIEGYTTAAAWELSDCLNLESIKLIGANLRKAVDNDPDGREGMALAQYVTAMAYSNVGLGIAHSMAHTLGAVYDTPHGVACAMMLPIVMEFNAEYTGEKYKCIAEALGVDTTGMDQPTYRKAAVDAVRQLSVDVGIPTKLEKLKEEDLPFIASAGVPIAYDFSLRWTDAYLARICPYIKVALLSCAHLDQEAREREMKKAASYGVPLVLGTIGEDGSWLLYRDRFYYAPAVLSDDVFDTMGAGDSYFATFLSTLLKKQAAGEIHLDGSEDLSEALVEAMNAGAAFAAGVCGMEGAFGYGVPIAGRIIDNRNQSV